MAEKRLIGGIANAGKVVRASPHVLRPSHAHSESIHALLRADAYRLDRDGRTELLDAMDDAIDRIEAAARRSVDAGDPNANAMLKRTGGIEKYDRRRRWWSHHHDQFAAALR